MSYELINIETRVARKTHRCIWCGERIRPGSSYMYEFSKFDGDIQRHHWHHECNGAAMDYFSAGDGPEFDPFNNERPPSVGDQEYDSWDCRQIGSKPAPIDCLVGKLADGYVFKP